MEKEKAISPLFSEFPSVTKEQWKEKVQKDLKGGDFEKLVWKTYEGFEVHPFYTKEDTDGLDYLNNFSNIIDRKSEALKAWENREKIKVTDPSKANRLAVDAVHGGADGLVFEIQNATVNFKQLLASIDTKELPVSIICHQSPVQVFQNYLDFLNEKQLDPAQITGSFEYDPMSAYTVSGKLSDQDFAQLAQLIKMAAPASKFYALTINSSHFKNSGATLSQELAFALNTAVNYIEKLSEQGLDPKTIISNLQFSLSLGTDYFMEIAKLKALRILFVQVAQAYGLSDFAPGDIQVHCFSSLWSKTIFDPSVNLLRDTTVAMSAILGGCNSLSIEPYDTTYVHPKPFLRRIARNVSIILRDESYLDKVVDPVSGSYYLENLIDELVKNGWQIFQQVEEKGGFLKAFEQGFVQDLLKKSRENKLQKIAARRDVIVGTNQYPNIKESVDPEEVKSIETASDNGVELLKPQRAAMEFEELRLDTEKYVKSKGSTHRPAVYLAEFGTNVIMRKARSSFSNGFFGTGGFNVIEGASTTTIKDTMEKIKASQAQIVVLCASDDDYAETGEEFARTFKSTFPDKFLVIAGYPKDVTDQLITAGVDEFVHLRSNAIETLRNFQKKLQII